MKIRIKGNSLRYRLTRSDVSTMEKERYLEERTEFANNTFIYALQVTDNGDMKADFTGNKITLSIPYNMVDKLANTDEVGFEHTDGKVFLLIEKDFTCLDNVAEDQSDNYPNPLADKLT